MDDASKMIFEQNTEGNNYASINISFNYIKTNINYYKINTKYKLFLEIYNKIKHYFSNNRI